MTWVSRASRLFDGATVWFVALCFLVLPSAFHHRLTDAPWRRPRDAEVRCHGDLRGAGRRYPLSRVPDQPAAVALLPPTARRPMWENGPGLARGAQGIAGTCSDGDESMTLAWLAATTSNVMGRVVLDSLPNHSDISWRISSFPAAAPPQILGRGRDGTNDQTCLIQGVLKENAPWLGMPRTRPGTAVASARFRRNRSSGNR
jgi:hypothetical protein